MAAAKIAAGDLTQDQKRLMDTRGPGRSYYAPSRVGFIAHPPRELLPYGLDVRGLYLVLHITIPINRLAAFSPRPMFRLIAGRFNLKQVTQGSGRNNLKE